MGTTTVATGARRPCERRRRREGRRGAQTRRGCESFGGSSLGGWQSGARRLALGSRQSAIGQSAESRPSTVSEPQQPAVVSRRAVRASDDRPSVRPSVARVLFPLCRVVVAACLPQSLRNFESRASAHQLEGIEILVGYLRSIRNKKLETQAAAQFLTRFFEE